ncbi:MAG: STAS domain-containing protein [Fibrobacteres bacterium]|nr:STAS domain-containing protein [Fibrobacterota bacterium]
MKTVKDKKAKIATVCLPEKAVREESSSLIQIVDELVKDGYKKIIFDFKETTMIDSATLGALIHIRRQHIEKETSLSITGVSGYVKTVIDNAKISMLFSDVGIQTESK